MWAHFSTLSLLLVIHSGCLATRVVPGNRENLLGGIGFACGPWGRPLNFDTSFYSLWNNVNSCSETCYPHDCWDVAAQGLKTDGVYLIYPGGKYSNPVAVYCDMTTKDGPWTVFQKRFDGAVSFYRGYKEYKAGFGRVDGEHWLGLQNIYLLTLKKSYQLRITLVDWDDVVRFVTYEDFSLSRLAVDPEEDGYRLYVDGFKEGDPTKPAGDSLPGHVGMRFSTHDNDQDMYTGNCAVVYHGAFWYNKCHGTNLNGKYQNGTTTEYATGVVWATAKGAYYSFKKTTMMITPAKSKE